MRITISNSIDDPHAMVLLDVKIQTAPEWIDKLVKCLRGGPFEVHVYEMKEVETMVVEKREVEVMKPTEGEKR